MATIEHSPVDVAADLETLKGVARLPAAEQPAVIARLLRNPSAAVREPTIRVAASTLSDDAVAGFLRNGEDDVLRNAGLEMLKQRGPQGFRLGVRLLHDREADVVLQAVLLLDHLRDPRALEPLRGVLHHANQNVVQSAIVAVGHVGHEGTVADLLPFLGADLWLQMAAIEAMGDLRALSAVRPLTRLLTDEMAGPLTAEALVRIGGSEAYAALAEHWLARDELSAHHLDLLAHVVEGTAGAMPEVEGLSEAVAARLEDPDRETRVAAARCLIALGPTPKDPEALDVLAGVRVDATVPACLRRRPDLIRRLLDMSGPCRGWGFRLAAQNPMHVPFDVFSAAVERTTEHEHFDAIGDALYAVGDGRLGRHLCALYARLPLETRLAWWPLLKRYRGPIAEALDEGVDAPPEMVQVLRSVVAETGEAAKVIVDLPESFRHEALAHATERDDVLQQLPWLEWLEQDPGRYGALAVRVADRAGLARHVERLRGLLRQAPHRELIRLAAQLGDAESIPVLADIVRDGPKPLRGFAVTALGQLGGDGARDALREVTGDPDMARFAYRALASCRTPEDLGVFRHGASHDDWHVRMVCATALADSDREEDVAMLAVLASDPVGAVADRARNAFRQ